MNIVYTTYLGEEHPSDSLFNSAPHSSLSAHASLSISNTSNTNTTTTWETDHNKNETINQDSWWGNYLTSINSSKTICIIEHNVKGLELYKPPANQKTHLLLENTYNQQAHILLLQENNIYFKNLEVHLAWNLATKNYWTGHHSSHSTGTTAPRTGCYLPGVTIASVLGVQSSRVIQYGTDSTGMGHYSWITLQGKEDHTITLISTYRICHMVTPGPFTAFSQQSHILDLHRNTNLDPRKETIKDYLNEFYNIGLVLNSPVIVYWNCNYKLILFGYQIFCLFGWYIKGT